MKKKLISALLVLLLCFTFVSCGIFDTVEEDPKGPTPLATPIVTVSDTGIASWQRVNHAEFYRILINNSVENTTELEVQLKLGDTISVKAVGDGENYEDSEYSAPITYTSKYTPHTHTWDGGTVTLAPDCDSEGTMTYACTGCSETRTEAIAPTSEHVDANEDDVCDACGGTMHVHVYVTEVYSATCGADGYTLHSCECGYSYKSDVVASTGAHADSNADDYCDFCELYCLVELDFYVFNDLHGSFMDTADQPGVDELTTFLKNKVADDAAHEIILSSGDMWQGSVESSSNKGALMTEWMNYVGFVAMTLGNHEYDWGSSAIKANKEIAEFPFLAINIYDGSAPADYCQPSVIVERGGVKIGIIGAMGDCKSSISGEFNQSLTFITGSALTTLVKDEATRLRQQMGCDLIVYSIHSGDSNDESCEYDVSLSNGYVDIVFEAHTHYSYSKTDSYGVPHIQAGGYNGGIGFANIDYNLITGELEVDSARVMRSNEYSSSSIEDDEIVNELYNKYFPDSDPYADVLGYNEAERNSTTLGNTIAQLYLEFGQEYWSEYDIVFAGGLLNTRPPYDLPSGDVTYADLYTLLPFDNDLVLGMVSGSTLKSQFANNSKYKKAFSDTYPTNINSSSMYYIVVDTYTAYYGWNNVTIVDRYSNYYSRDLLAEYIKDGGYGKRQTVSSTSTIEDILHKGAGTYKTEAIVVGVTDISIVVNDNTGMMLVYLGKSHTFREGDLVTLEGTVATYGGNYQFTQDTKVTLINYGKYTQPTPRALTGADISAITTPFEVEYVTITGTLSISVYTNATYYNVTINGTNYIGSISTPTVDLSEYDGKTITVTGYITGITSSRYLNIVMTDIQVTE